MLPSQNVTTTEFVRAQAASEISVGGETLSISKVHMWRDAQPRVSSPAEEAAHATSPEIMRPLNLALTITRKPASTPASSTDGLDSSVLPYIVSIHTLREGQSTTSHTELNTAPDDPVSSHFAWPAPPAMSATESPAEEPAYEGAYFLAQTMDNGAALSLSAWNGPTWGTLRNGIDDMIDYIAVVEFEGGHFLSSDKQRVEVVH